jgi:2-polyprenyl-3-methyl-5-hydroxy-6-metoxy-1,4-benzoquinol methylase
VPSVSEQGRGRGWKDGDSAGLVLTGAPCKTSAMVDSDKHWIRFGQFDPYLKTVKTLDPYKLDPSLPPTSEFYFESGDRYLTDLFGEVGRCMVPGFRPKRAVDFGCSVGRIAVPLAARCESMIGVDISPEALAEAEKNAANFRVTNAQWVLSDDDLSRIDGPIDLFHSYNVLQHLPVSRGLAIIRRALALLNPAGVIAVHVPYADLASGARRAINWAQAHVPGVGQLANVVRGRPRDYPHMLMNPYDLGAILSILRDRGCERVHCRFIDQQRYPGTIVIAQVPDNRGLPGPSKATTGQRSA